MSGAPSKIAGPGLFRPTAFRLGLLAGVAAVLAFGAFIYVWAIAPFRPPEFNVEVVSHGADVSRQGGVKIAVVQEREALTQTCNGACDDLRYRAQSLDNKFHVEVSDARGACIACNNGSYVSSGYGSWVTRWTIIGPTELRVVVDELNADGTPLRP